MALGSGQVIAARLFQVSNYFLKDKSNESQNDQLDRQKRRRNERETPTNMSRLRRVTGELHGACCDVEPCPYCGRQLLTCDHCFKTPREGDRIPWTGEWPGTAECKEFGWFARARCKGVGILRSVSSPSLARPRSAAPGGYLGSKRKALDTRKEEGSQTLKRGLMHIEPGETVPGPSGLGAGSWF